MSVSMDSGMGQGTEVVSPDDVCIIAQDVWASFLDVHIDQVMVDDAPLAGRSSIVGAVRVTDAWFGAVVLELTPGLARQVAGDDVRHQPRTSSPTPRSSTPSAS